MKNQIVNVRCTSTQKVKAEFTANACGLSLSTFVKRTALGERTSVALPLTYRNFNRELLFIENNLDQIAKVSKAKRLPCERRACDAIADVRRRVLLLQIRVGW